MNYIRVFNYSASPVVVKGIQRTYVVRGCGDHGPIPEDMPFEDIDYINARCDVFRTGVLRFADEVADELMQTLRNPNWRDTVVTDDQLIEQVTHPTNEFLRQIIACTKRSEIERYRAALVAAQNGNLPVTELVNRIVRDRFAEIANGVTRSKIVLPDDYLEQHMDPRVREIDELRNQNAAMSDQLAALQKQIEALTATTKEKAEKTKAPKAARAKAPKDDPKAE